MPDYWPSDLILNGALGALDVMWIVVVALAGRKR